MSTTFALPFSVDQQKANINANLNSTLLFQFVTGIYTGVFPATLYIYFQKESRTVTKNRIVSSSLTGLYLGIALYTATNWLYTNNMLCTHGGTRAEIFYYSGLGVESKGVDILTDIVTRFLIFFLADGLLVWRCFYACGGSFRRCSMPIGLFAVETGLLLTGTVYQIMLDTKPEFSTAHNNQIEARITVAMYVSVAMTSLVSTFEICRQIYTRTMPGSRPRKRYRALIMALIDSSACYSAMVIFEAILYSLDTGKLQSSFTIILIEQFVNPISELLAGLAPTLMVAMLTFSSGQENTEVISTRLPSELMSPVAALVTRDDIPRAFQQDIEMQPVEPSAVEKEKGDNEIMVLSRTGYIQS